MLIQLTERDHFDDEYEPRPVWIAADKIIRLYERGAVGSRYTRIEAAGAHFSVAETPEQILRALGTDKADGDE